MNLRAFSLFTIASAFGLLILGGFFHASGASLSCFDWPLCYGARATTLPLHQHVASAHRVLGLVVGLQTLILFFWAKRLDNPAFKKCSLALLLVIIQGLLGLMTALYQLPTIISTSHFILSLFFIATLISIYFSQLADLDQKAEHQNISFYTDWSGIAIALVLVSLSLSSLVRHSGSFEVCKESLMMCLSKNQLSDFWPRQKLNILDRVTQFVVCFFTLILSFKTINFFSQSHLLGKKSILSSSKRLILLSLPLPLIRWLSLEFHPNPYLLALEVAVGAFLLFELWWLFLSLQKVENSFSKTYHTFFRDLLSLTKPRLGLLVMSTVFVGMMLHPETISFFRAFFGLCLIAMVVMGAATLNCYLEKETDALMERTKDRPLPSQRMKKQTALIIGLVFLAISLPLLFLFINPTTAYLGAIATVLYVWAYTPLKTKSEIALYVGAIPGAIPPVMGWTMINGKFDMMAFVLFVILFVWQLPHFLAISTYLNEEYRSANIVVYPNKMGMKVTQWGIFILTGVLFLSALAPYYLDFRITEDFFWWSVFINSIFLFVSLKLLFIDSKDIGKIQLWAKRYFVASIVYLPLVLGSLIFLR